jgi:hypothetical protein
LPEPEVLGRRALNRALLERQLLQRRADTTPLAAIAHLAGMQAQAPNAPYVGLWTRLAGFRTDQLAALLAERAVVRTHLMRNTVHLVSARDGLAIRRLMQPFFERSFAHSVFARDLTGVDLTALLDAGRVLLRDRALTRGELGGLLERQWPGRDRISMAHAITHLVPAVQVPPRGIWGCTGQAAYTATEAWLGDPTAPPVSPDDLVLRYLAAFGPAAVRDVQAWCGLTRMREVTERLRPRLRTFRDSGGAELFDLPDAPRPDPDTPAPPRFLPEYDNVLLSHADRTRIIPGRRRVPLPPGLGGTTGTLLIDGFWRATWKIRRSPGGTVTLRVQPFTALSAEQAAAVTTEGTGLLAFVAPGAEASEIQLAAPNLSEPHSKTP